MDVAFVYILRCADGSFYTGITRRTVEARVSEHNAGLLVDCIKGWSRAKKIALVRADYDALKRFSSRASPVLPPILPPHAEEPPSGGVSKHGPDVSP